jgi:hypothetical protein
MPCMHAASPPKSIDSHTFLGDKVSKPHKNKRQWQNYAKIQRQNFASKLLNSQGERQIIQTFDLLPSSNIIDRCGKKRKESHQKSDARPVQGCCDKF